VTRAVGEVRAPGLAGSSSSSGQREKACERTSAALPRPERQLLGGKGAATPDTFFAPLARFSTVAAAFQMLSALFGTLVLLDQSFTCSVAATLRRYQCSCMCFLLCAVAPIS
jgi:hypothetical protein